MELQAQIYQLNETENGLELLKRDQDTLSPLEILMSKAFLQGESLFTSLLVEKQKIWFLQDHLDRLLNSIEWYFDYSNTQVEMLKQVIASEMEQLNFKSDFSYRRMTFFESSGRKYFVIFTKPFQDPRTKLRSLELTSFYEGPRTIHRHSHKWGNYLAANLIRRNLGSDQDLLHLDSQQKILELSSSNIFFSDGQAIFTPQSVGEFLPGIYRKNIIILLKEKGWRVREEEIRLSQVRDFKFAFATNCLSGISEIHSIDHHIYKDKDSEFLRSLKKELY